MVRKSIWLILLISMVGIGLISSGCARRETVQTTTGATTAMKGQTVTMGEAPNLAAPTEEQRVTVGVASGPPAPMKEQAPMTGGAVGPLPKKEQTVTVGVAPSLAAPASKEPATAEAAPMEKPQEEAKAAPEKAVPEEAQAKPEEKPAEVVAKPPALDLASLRIQFAFDDSNLSTKSEENLNKIAEWMKSHPDTKIEIQGYTCDIGTNEYNLALSDQRAKSAKKYLEGLGVDHTRISSTGYGKEHPRVPNTNEAHRSMNRRDEFVWASAAS